MVGKCYPLQPQCWHRSVPIAIVKLRNKSKATRAMPAKKAAMATTISTASQLVEQGIQCELPRDRLRPH